MPQQTILYTAGRYTVRPATFGKDSKPGYAVFEDGPTAAVRVAQIGYPGGIGLSTACHEADRRHDLDC